MKTLASFCKLESDVVTKFAEKSVQVIQGYHIKECY